MSPSICAAHGPSTTVLQSRSLTPARGPAIGRQSYGMNAPHGTRSPAAHADRAGVEAVLGRIEGGQAPAAEVLGVRERLLLSARCLPPLPVARDRLGPGERTREAARVRD